MTDEVFGFNIYTSSVSPSGCHLPLKGKALCCRVQHIFNKYAVAGGGVVDKDMRYSADQLAILDDGAAGHADVK